ncbi:MAG: PEP-CTERM sorting domain-containing protein [Phycisphaerales bacterium]
MTVLKLTKTFIASFALAAAATPALADGERLFFEISNDISPDQPSAVVTLWAGFDARDWALAGVAGSVVASEGNWFALELVPPLNGPGTTPGVRTGGGSTVEGIIAGQLNFPSDILADPSNPIAFWRAEIEVFDFTPRTIDLATDTSRFDVYIDRDSASSRSALADLQEAMGTVVVVPAPASVALFAAAAGLSGLCRPRRRCVP